MVPYQYLQTLAIDPFGTLAFVPCRAKYRDIVTWVGTSCEPLASLHCTTCSTCTCKRTWACSVHMHAHVHGQHLHTRMCMSTRAYSPAPAASGRWAGAGAAAWHAPPALGPSTVPLAAAAPVAAAAAARPVLGASAD